MSFVGEDTEKELLKVIAEFEAEDAKFAAQAKAFALKIKTVYLLDKDEWVEAELYKALCEARNVGDKARDRFVTFLLDKISKYETEKSLQRRKEMQGF